jgi:tellurite resistance-related uncharacterized protein
LRELRYSDGVHTLGPCCGGSEASRPMRQATGWRCSTVIASSTSAIVRRSGSPRGSTARSSVLNASVPISSARFAIAANSLGPSSCFGPQSSGTSTQCPDALRRAHRVATGTWARLCVAQGAIRFVAQTDPVTDVIVDARRPQGIPPDVEHYIETDAATRFAIEFLGPKPDQRHVLPPQPIRRSMTRTTGIFGVVCRQPRAPADLRFVAGAPPCCGFARDPSIGRELPSQPARRRRFAMGIRHQAAGVIEGAPPVLAAKTGCPRGTR